MLPEQSPSSGNTENNGSLRRRSATSLLSVVPIERAIKMPAAAEPPVKLCAACHSSCLKCFGPNDYDCMACATDSMYTERAANESYCSPIAINLYDGNLYGVLLVLVPALFILCLVLSISWLIRTKWWAARGGSDRAGYTYEKVEFDGTDETVNLSHEVTVDGSSSTCSDSEEDPP